MLDTGRANFGPGSLGVPEMTWMDGPSFKLIVRVFPEFPLLVPFIVLLPLSVSALAY